MNSLFAEHALPNGLRIVCETLPRVRSAAVGFLVRTGARHEAPHEHGVSHFLEHMCFKGTPRRSGLDINVRFDDLGSIYNAFTGKEHTVYYGWVPAAALGDQLELLADMMRPAIPPADFDTERNVILEEIAMAADNFDHHVWNFLHQTIFGSHPLGHEVLGERETIAALPRKVMVDYHARRYSAANVTLLASGDLEPEAVFAEAARHCAGWTRNGAARPQPAAPPLPTGARFLQLPQFKQQTVALLYPSVAAAAPEAESIEALQSIFGGHNSRCFWNIVQRGICAGAGAAWISYQDVGFFALYAVGEPERCEEMVAALRTEAQALAAVGVSDEEVRRVVNQRRTSEAVEAENPRTRFMQLVDDLETLGYPRSAGARLAAIEAVSADSIAGYLKRYPITGEGLLLSIGPRAWP